MNKTGSQPGMLLGWMEALADATRLRLLRLLERHELGVIDLCDVLQLPQSTVSREQCIFTAMVLRLGCASFVSSFA